MTMRISTLLSSGVLRGVTVAAVCSLGISASAQTFLDNGIIYKVNKGKVEVQPTKYTSGAKKGQPTVCENGEAPDQYTGDVVIPATVTYNGVEYPVSTVAAGFKASLITSLTLPDGNGIKIGRGGLQDCAELVSVKLPSDFAFIEGNTFQGCAKLSAISIPGSVTTVSGAAFTGCEALETIVIEESATPIVIGREAFGGAPVVKTLVMNRQISSDKYNNVDERAFRGAPNLSSVTVGGSFVNIPANYFENLKALKTIVFNSPVVSIDYNGLAGNGLEELTLPATVTTLSSSVLKDCKSLRKVTLGENVTEIGAMAFYNSVIEEINLPASLKTIGNLAFSGTKLSGVVTIPEAVTSIGDQAFANNAAITKFVIPASVKSIGVGAFMGCAGVAAFEVAADNANYSASADGSYITSKDGMTVVAYAPAAAATEFKGDFTAVAPYAFYGAKNLQAINLPACGTWGDYSVRGAGVKTLSLAGNVGRYVAADCPNLTDITVGCMEVPTGVVYNCPEVSKVTLLPEVTIVRQDAFANCPKIESLDLGNVLVILETNCFGNSGIKNLTVASTYPASMGEGVFSAESGITVTVPADLVGAYQAATGWNLLTIVGDANLLAGGAKMGMAPGLYYSGDDDNLHCLYADGKSDDYVINMPHTFQLVEFNNRIYGASAGRKFWYSASSAVEGDGKLFYISKVDDNLFQAVVLDNTGNNAYKDPTGLYIYGSTLYVNDRNVCIRKISADALALPQDYPSWMENNWMSWYGGNPWTYGCIKNGFAITQDQDAEGNPEPRYWVGMKYNGCGLFSFKEGNIGKSASEVGSPNGTGTYLVSMNPIATCFNIDSKNRHLYIYIETAGTESSLIKGGLYRVSLDALAANPDPSVSDFFGVCEAKLIDGSPVKYEGNATNEHVGISQLAFDENGEYMYWCYRAPSAEEAAANEAQTYAQQSAGRYWWADAYDANNPLHQSGIKRIKLGEENPVVEMVAPGVTGYGLVCKQYEGSVSPSGVAAPAIKPAISAVSVANGEVTALEATTVVVYNTAGAIVAVSELAAGQTMAMPAGLHLVEARTAAGTQLVKVAK